MSSNTMWPLDQEASVTHVIAGKSIKEHQSPILGDDITASPNTWVCQNDADALIAKGNAALIDSNGQTVATIGNGAEKLQVSDSFFIKYPWQLLDVASQVVGTFETTVLAGSVHPNAVIDGHVALGENSKILPGVYIEGNVTIGENCKIGPNCYIRGNTSIGDKCHIGQSVEIKNSIIGSNTNVGHLSYVGDSVIGDHANLGAGTIISNFRHDGGNHRSMVSGQLADTGRRKFGSIIGNQVHTGINTSIYPGRKIGTGCSTLPCDIVKYDIKED